MKSPEIPNPLPEWHGIPSSRRSLSPERAQEILDQGYDGFGANEENKPRYRSLLTYEEALIVTEAWAVGSNISFNGVIRRMAIPGKFVDIVDFSVKPYEKQEIVI